MTCNKIKNLLGPYIYGDLSLEEMALVRRHVDNCQDCREDLRQRMAVTSALDTNVPQLNEDDVNRIKWYVKGAVSNGVHKKYSLSMRLIPAFGAVLVLILGFAFGKWLGAGASVVNNTRKTSARVQSSSVAQRSVTIHDKKEVRSLATNNLKDSAHKSELRDTGQTETAKAERYQAITDTVRNMGTVGLATTRSNSLDRRRHVIVLEEPLPVTAESDGDNSEVRPNENKLPSTDAPNSVQTADTPDNQ